MAPIVRLRLHDKDAFVRLHAHNMRVKHVQKGTWDASSRISVVDHRGNLPE